ncbi:MAG: fibronectin type III domain-containing protein [Planctomycetes bacterium]|nr:fibronectin type III domain-containing protein [Planctomycetota bacterium]
MPDFPRQQAKISQLANEMLYGFFGHMADFPHINVFKIFNGIRDYKLARDKSNKARARALLATSAKQASFKTLKTIMKQSLKRSTVDTADHPEKLALIGWSAADRSSTSTPPGAPWNLNAQSTDSRGSVILSWQKPTHGGPVFNYLIQRRRADHSQWEPVTIAYQNQITLTNQPQDIQLEYLIIAANKSGSSPPGNTVTVIL